jgi:hypothetical protein
VRKVEIEDEFEFEDEDDLEPRPGGTVEVMVSSRDICRRNGVDAALERLGIPVER